VRKGSPIQSIDDLREKEILVHAQAYSHDWLTDHHVTDQIIAVSSPQEALQLLASGRHDGAVIDRLRALRHSDRRFQELCDLLPQTVFETDANGHITFLNRSGLDMLGLDEETVLTGIHLSNFLPGDPDLDEWAHTGDQCGKTCVVSGPDIDAFPALLCATPVVSGGGYSGL